MRSGCSLYFSLYFYTFQILFNETFVGLTCWDSACLGCQLIDLYTYMRKILEKWDYDLKLGEEMLCAYLEKSQESADVRKLMAALFLYPEKLWKVVNVYFNSKKTNVFKKNMDKLNMCLAQRECKNVFAMSLLQR